MAKKGKLENMLGGLLEEFMIRESAKAVIENAEAKIELTVKCNGDTAKVSISYEGNGGGYFYAAYALISEAMKRSGIGDIDHFLKIIKSIDDLMKKPDDEKEKNEDKAGAEETAD